MKEREREREREKEAEGVRNQIKVKLFSLTLFENGGSIHKLSGLYGEG